MVVGWWGLCFLVYGVLLDWFATLWFAQNPVLAITFIRAQLRKILILRH